MTITDDEGRRTRMSRYRIGICRILHESNSFISGETSLADFRTYGGILLGAEVLDCPDRRDEIAGFLQVLRRADEHIETVPFLSTGGFASGLISAEMVDYLGRALRQALRGAGELDGILFALHGAMASADIPDLDGHFLEIVRQHAGADIPVVCTLDMHAVVTRRMVELAMAFTAYRTHPHVDVFETGERAAEILLSALRGEIRPVMAWQRAPMMFPPPDDGTLSGALRDAAGMAAASEGLPNVVTCSHCAGYPWLDIQEQGWTTLAVTNGDESQARRLAARLAREAWAARRELMPAKMLPPREAVRAAARLPGNPIVITDSADTVGGGAPGDTTQLLAALLDLRKQVDGLILASLPDPDSVATVMHSGEGAAVDLLVGGKRDARFSRPLRVQGEVLCITDGMIEDVGKFGPTPFVDVGHIVSIAIDNVRLVLTERVVDGPQPSLFRKVGIEPFDAKIVALKTGVGYKATYSQAAGGVVRADCPGATSYNLSSFEYTRVPRPLFPLDPDMDWEPEESCCRR